MKVKLIKDDWFVYIMDAYPWEGPPATEVPDELFEEYGKALSAFNMVQDKIEVIYRENRNKAPHTT